MTTLETMALIVFMRVALPPASSLPAPASVRVLEQTVPELMRKHSVPGSAAFAHRS